MAQDWNPNSPDAIGLEWRPFARSSRTPTIAQDWAIQWFRSTAAESIDAVRLLGQQASEPLQTTRYVAEVFPADGEEPTDVQYTVLTPNAATLGPGATTNGSPAIDVVQQTPGVNEGKGSIFLNGDDEYVDIEFPTASGTFTGRRILTVELEIAGWGDLVGEVSRRFVSARVGGANHDWIGTVTQWITGDQNNQEVQFIGGSEIHPESLQPFTDAELEAFDVTATCVRLRIDNDVSTTGDSWRIMGVRMNVRHCAENRLARGAIVRTQFPVAPSAANWQEVPLLDPDGVSSWAKADATDYALVVRQVRDLGGGSTSTGTLAFPFLYGDEPPPASQQMRRVDTIVNNVYLFGESSNGTLAPSAGSALETGLLPMILRTDAPGFSVDSLPYAEVTTRGVLSGTEISQTFQAPASADFAPIFCLVAWDTADGLSEDPADDLDVAIKRVSDDAVMGSASFSAAFIRANGVEKDGTYFGPNHIVYEILLQISVATLVSGTDYYISFASTNAAGEALWEVVVLDALSSLGDGGDAGTTFGGTTYSIESNGAPDTDQDLAGFAAQEPDPPTALTATADTEAVAQPPAGTDAACLPTAVGVIDLAWTASANGASFARYEIERYDARTGSWEQIATIASEATESFTDYEPRLAIESCYRIRAVATSGATSVWNGGEVLLVLLTDGVNDFASSPDSAAADSTGEVDLRALIRPDALSADEAFLIGKYRGSVANSSYALIIDDDVNNDVLLGLSDGTTLTLSRSTSGLANVGLGAGDTFWVRATWRASDGRIQFFYSADQTLDHLAVSWSQLGADVTDAKVSLNNSTEEITIGARNRAAPQDEFDGELLRALILNGIGGTVAVDFYPHRDASAGALAFTSQTGEIWTLNNGASIGASSSSAMGVPSCATPADGGCLYSFTSNADPAEIFAYADTEPARRGALATRPYDFPEASEVEYRRIYGRDLFVEFHPTERRGVAFARSLMVDGFTAPSLGPGPEVFEAFRDFIWRADVPYVCVRDESGNRWYASVVVPDATVLAPGAFHMIEARVREIASSPESVSA